MKQTEIRTSHHARQPAAFSRDAPSHSLPSQKATTQASSRFRAKSHRKIAGPARAPRNFNNGAAASKQPSIKRRAALISRNQARARAMSSDSYPPGRPVQSDTRIRLIPGRRGHSKLSFPAGPAQSPGRAIFSPPALFSPVNGTRRLALCLSARSGVCGSRGCLRRRGRKGRGGDRLMTLASLMDRFLRRQTFIRPRKQTNREGGFAGRLLPPRAYEFPGALCSEKGETTLTEAECVGNASG